MTEAQFTVHYDKCAGALLGFLVHRYGADRAEDLASDTWLRAWRWRDTFRGDCKFMTWLTHIAMNQSASMYRSGTERVRMKSVPITYNIENMYFTTACAERSLIARQTVENALDSMSQNNAGLFRMRYVFGMKVEDMAGVQRVKTSTMKSRLSRLRRAFAR